MPRDSKRARQAISNEPDDNYVRLLIQEALQKEKLRKSEGINTYIKRKANPNGLKPNTNFLNRVVKSADFHNTALLKKEAEDAAARLKELNELEKPSRSTSKSPLRASRKRRSSIESQEGQEGSSRPSWRNGTDKSKNLSYKSSCLPCREESYYHFEGSALSDYADVSSATTSSHHDRIGRNLHPVSKHSLRLSQRERDSGCDSDGDRYPHHREHSKRRRHVSKAAEDCERRHHGRYDEKHHTSSNSHSHIGHEYDRQDKSQRRSRHRDRGSIGEKDSENHLQRHKSDCTRDIESQKFVRSHDTSYQRKDRDEHWSSLRLNGMDDDNKDAIGSYEDE
ncbi:uncharacterized protein V1513DRAFT_456829 [Lipomyces chichibuensis]|uniref:uncharacterized protein n=1 Tax=Lipomyces chichibuensis TaxID=1546026 RepID=UPI003343545D